jgi:threonine dehydrogenase-like Zn-dependent dehydrogenase
MRAAVITGPQRCELVTVDLPVPTRDQVLVKVEGCGVCGSNLPRWEGRPWFTYPAEPGNPGHEGWGTVVATGGAVKDIAIGDRVAFLSDHAFAEYDVSSAFVKLPPALTDVPGEPLGCVMNIWRRSNIEKNQNVAIIGLGFLGALLTQLAAKAGANVIAISQRPWSLEMAKLMGASDTIELGLDDAEIVARVEELTDGQGCERVIEVVGLQRPLDLATKLARVRGTIVIAGFHQDGPRTIDMFQWNWRGLDVVNAHERDPREYLAGMRAAIDAVSTGQLDPRLLYTHKVPLAEAGRAFELLRTRPDGFVKALVTP